MSYAHTHTHMASVLLAVVCFRVLHCANGSEGPYGMYSDPTVVVKTWLQARPLPGYHAHTHTYTKKQATKQGLQQANEKVAFMLRSMGVNRPASK